MNTVFMNRFHSFSRNNTRTLPKCPFHLIFSQLSLNDYGILFLVFLPENIFDNVKTHTAIGP